MVKRKNWSIQEMARVMLHAKEVPLKSWVEAMNTTSYVLNRVSIKPLTNQTCYEMWKGKNPTVKYFNMFGSVYYIPRDQEVRQKTKSKE